MRHRRKKLITLAGMLALDESALICDLAETYGVLNYRALPAEIAATLCAGLRDNSRIKMKCGGVSATPTGMDGRSRSRQSQPAALGHDRGRAEGKEPPRPIHGVADLPATQTVQM